MACGIAPIMMTWSDLHGQSRIASLLKCVVKNCNAFLIRHISNCAAVVLFDKISTVIECLAELIVLRLTRNNTVVCLNIAT